MDPKDCSCSSEYPICSEDICMDGSPRDINCMCPEEYLICTMDMCWDGSSRDPIDCSCPPEIYCDACPPGAIAGEEMCSCIFECESDRMCMDGSFPMTTECWCLEDMIECPRDLCWDGSSRDPRDCSCPEELFCTEDLCADGSVRYEENWCMCPEDYPVCTMDICWDGSSRDPMDCSCPD